jgi:phosphatidylinositol-3-phosphatase
MKLFWSCCLASLLLIITGCMAHSPRQVSAHALPPIGHVFIIVLENKGFEETFGAASPAPYLARTLTSKGALLENYYGIGHFSLDNYIAMVSGVSPNIDTQSDCRIFSDFAMTGMSSDGQPIGHGCVYPKQVQTIAGQLDATGRSWKAYMDDMGNNPQREAKTCGHPAIGAQDGTQRAEAPSKAVPNGDQYATRHNPFVYFHSIIDGPICETQIVGLPALKQDLRTIETTPNYAFITPNLCHDGHDGSKEKPCVNGEPGGLVSADKFLQEIVPAILASPAFKKDGLLIVTFDEADIDVTFDKKTGKAVVADADATACCSEPAGPNIASGESVFGFPVKGPGIVGPGGGRIGAVLVSPFIKPGTVSAEPYNHYALLASLEDLFALPHLGYAGQTGLKGFGSDVFTAYPAP